MRNSYVKESFPICMDFASVISCVRQELSCGPITRQRSIYLVFNTLRKSGSGIVKNEHLLPATNGVYGDWGGGKSSLIQMATAELEKGRRHCGPFLQRLALRRV